MKTVTFCNGKGGVGKTTITILIASILHDEGFSVSVDDRDTLQGSATQFAKALGIPLGTKGDIVLIDTAPKLDHGPSLTAIEIADLVLLITSPSPTDLATTIRTSEIIKSRRGKKLTKIMLNSVAPNTRLSREVGGLELPFPTLKNVLKRRQCFQLAPMEGLRALPSNAKAELNSLALEIVGLLK